MPFLNSMPERVQLYLVVLAQTNKQTCVPPVCSKALAPVSSPYPVIMPVFVPLPLPPSKPVIIHTGALPSTFCKLVKFPVVHNVTLSPCNFGQYL